MPSHRSILSSQTAPLWWNIHNVVTPAERNNTLTIILHHIAIVAGFLPHARDGERLKGGGGGFNEWEWIQSRVVFNKAYPEEKGGIDLDALFNPN